MQATSSDIPFLQPRGLPSSVASKRIEETWALHADAIWNTLRGPITQIGRMRRVGIVGVSLTVPTFSFYPTSRAHNSDRLDANSRNRGCFTHRADILILPDLSYGLSKSAPWVFHSRCRHSHSARLRGPITQIGWMRIVGIVGVSPTVPTFSFYLI